MPAKWDAARRLLQWTRGHIGRGSIVLLTLGILLVAMVGYGGAVTAQVYSVPTEAQVGEEVSATVVLGELYQNPSYEQWTLRGMTELKGVTWTVRSLNQDGDVSSPVYFAGGTFSVPVNLESDVAEIRVKITGDVPPRASRSFLLVEFRQTREGGVSYELGSWHVDYSSPSTPTPLEVQTPTPRKGQTSTPRKVRTPTAQATPGMTTPETSPRTEQVYRGFFSNSPTSGSSWAILDGPQITAIGLALSIVGMLFQLRRGS